MKKPSHRTVVQIDIQNDLIPISEPASCGSQYSIVIPKQTTVVGNITPTRNCINDQQDLTAENGRINFSNRTPSHGTRHVVNMLGKFCL